jgi:DNA-binding winged helix-turn-helix (wHTH) protein
MVGICESERFFSFGPLAFDRRNQSLFFDGERVKLARKTAACLVLLGHKREAFLVSPAAAYAEKV